MESQILHAAIKSRDSFDLIEAYLNPRSYSKEFQVILGKIKEYYQRDRDSKAVNEVQFMELVLQSIPNEKHQARFRGIIEEAIGVETSIGNMDELIIGARKNEVADKLAVKLGNRDPAAAELIQEYNKLSQASSLRDLEENDIETITSSDMAAIIRAITTGRGTLKLYPAALDKRIEGGLRGGHHVTTFAPPEMGKTGLNVTIAAGFAKQDALGLYIGNEDPAKTIYFRLLSCMSGMTKAEINNNPELAMNRAKARGIDNVILLGLTPGTINEIDALMEEYEPKWVIVDQLLNLKVKAESRTNELEMAARGIRTLGKKHDCVMVSTTQAGDSAEGKAMLTMGDVYMSNTGIPGAADLMLGIGASAEQLQQGYRTISVPKNKINGDHNPVVVRFNPALSRYISEE